MAVYVALLRAVNVGARRVAMADVRDALAKAGHPDCTTHLQSGNVILEAGERSAATVEDEIGRTLSVRAGFDIDVMVRTGPQLERVLGSDPLGAGDTAGRAYGFLKTKPSAAAARALAGADFGDDRFALKGAELYLRYPSGMGRSKMTGAYFERVLKTRVTVRNHNVVTKLAQLARER